MTYVQPDISATRTELVYATPVKQGPPNPGEDRLSATLVPPEDTLLVKGTLSVPPVQLELTPNKV